MLQNCLRSLLTHRPCDEAGAMAFSEVVVRRGMGLSVFASCADESNDLCWFLHSRGL
jgi:hypothetical protein